MPPPFKNKVEYRGDTNDKTRESDDNPSGTYGCVRNLDYEHKNEEYDKYIEPPSGENYRIKSKISEGITEKDVRKILSANKNSLKVIKVVLFTIDNHKKDILAVGY